MQPNEQRRFKRQYQKHLTALKLRNMSPSAQDVYARAVRRVSTAYDCCPDRLTPDELRQHFVALIDSHSWSTVRSDRAGLQFFFKHVVNKPMDWGTIVKPKRVQSLPDVITHAQVANLINATREQRYETFFLCTYSMGLRLGEALALQVLDIDAAQRRIHVRLGKGNKDRYVFLPQRTLLSLRRYWATHRHPKWLFPDGRTAQEKYRATKTMSASGVQRSIKRVSFEAGIRTRVTTHTLRHAYATHLLERGLSLQHIQQLLGHASITTTLVYTKLTEPAQQQAGELVDAMIQDLPVTLDAVE
ncbi:tyrosine-type recombinase/integrase [Granulosicoccus sp. 3-233]|uniref:tyrosine-type recombinase/integrase n=1 Tax=Granulosicoccus sp. 3-233 TaxID=3417969 RepID=UPI003D331AB9